MVGVDGSWLRAYSGRVLHFFVTTNETLCGKELVARWYTPEWQHWGYPRCKRCLKRFEALRRENETDSFQCNQEC